MTEIVQFLMNHGYPTLFVAVFARQIGLPIPAPGFLLAAGALAAAGRLDMVHSITLAVIGCVVADWAWYEAGRGWGERVLHFIHRFAPDPGAADRRSRKLFGRHGCQLLVLDKFVPGLDAVVPPLAGTSGVGRLRFLTFETVGASLWSSAYTGLGYIFGDHLDRAAAYVGKAGTWLAGAVACAIVFYVARKLSRWPGSRRSFQFVPVTGVNPTQPTQASQTREGVNHE